jgi:hypothetical protein
VRVNTPTGQMTVSVPEVTAFDVVQFANVSGGLSNAATVVVELAQDGLLDTERLNALASSYPASVAARLGWMLERHGGVSGLDVVQARASALSTPVPLSAGGGGGELDRRWNVMVNADVEVDV